MSDDLVKRLRETTNVFQADCELKMKCAAYIEQLAATNEELEADRKKTYEAMLKVTRIHDEAEAKLAKAENALFTLSHIHDGNPSDAMADILPLDYARNMLWEARNIARNTLAELKGQDDE